MAKDQEKAARQNYAAKAKDRGHRAHKFLLEGFPPTFNPARVSLAEAQAMSARNKQKMVGSARQDAIRTPSLG